MSVFNLENNMSDILLIEEGNEERPKIEVPCEDCQSTGFILNRKTMSAKKCPKCTGKRTIAIRRSRMKNIPKHLQKFPIEFDEKVGISLSTYNTKGELLKEITNKKEVEDKVNNKIIELMDKGSSFILFGNKGSGKTMVACGIAVKTIELGKKVIFMMANEISDASFRYSGNQAEYRELFTSDLLVIDSLGSEFVDSKEFRTSFLVKILAARTSQKKPTLITCNLVDMKAVANSYGKKTIDILAQNFVSLELKTKNNFALNLANKASEEFAS